MISVKTALTALAVVQLLLAGYPTHAQAASADARSPKSFITHHKLQTREKSFAYTAQAEETYITNVAGEPTASIFSFTYTRDGAQGRTRPVLFLFNGGPGSSSAWLHMGVFGPRRAMLDREVNPSSVPPFSVADNPDTPLDVCDLVFIDPVGTGFSHAVGKSRDADFFGVDADAESMARFIEAWLTKHHRWRSPKYVLGVSYGSARAAILPRALMGGFDYVGLMRGITLDGVILGAVKLELPTASGQPGEPDSATMILPTFAAAAWYHEKIARDGRTVAQIYEEVRQFGATRYAQALALQDAGTLSDEDRNGIARQLENYTGVPSAEWIANELRISPQLFSKLLLADRHLEIGTYDSRYTLSSSHNGGDLIADEPAMTQYIPGYVAAFHSVLADDLNVEMPRPYTAISFQIFPQWNQAHAGVPGALDYAADLASAMRRNSALRVMVASGYYDMATPAAEAARIVSRSLPPERVTYRYYEAGHPLFDAGFARDVSAFISGKRK